MPANRVGVSDMAKGLYFDKAMPPAGAMVAADLCKGATLWDAVIGFAASKDNPKNTPLDFEVRAAEDIEAAKKLIEIRFGA